MAIIYRERDGIRYSELSCTTCRDGFAVSQQVLDFYDSLAPAQPYLCPTCRRWRDQNAVVYGSRHHLWMAPI